MNFRPQQRVGFGREILPGEESEAVGDNVERGRRAHAFDPGQTANQSLVTQDAAERPSRAIFTSGQRMQILI